MTSVSTRPAFCPLITLLTYLRGPGVTRTLYQRAPPTEFTPLICRLFGTWNLLSTIVRFYAAYDIHNGALYNLAALTFVVALFHFGVELGVHGSVGGRQLIAAEITPVVTLGWMLWARGWIDVPRRLRRAIYLNDLALVKRIVRNNRTYLRNPDFEDKSNTSLHLAAKHGFAEIAEYLIEAGHESEGISRNNDWETPLMMAAAADKADVGILLANHFPECIPWSNKLGLDTLMLASRSGTMTLLTVLINANPSIITACDIDGNTALHHASAAGQLKALRLLLQYGANPMAQNAYSWTPVHYSATSAAEVYFKNLIAEIEKKRVEGAREKRERQRAIGGVRLVTNDDSPAGMSPSGERQRAIDDASIAGLPAPGMEWSPVQQRRAMTPTAGRTEGFFGEGARARAYSGD